MKSINFIKYIRFYFGLSAVVIGVGLAALAMWGLRPAVDFAGGSLIQIRIEGTPAESWRIQAGKEGQEGGEGATTAAMPPSEGSIREALAEVGIDAHSVQSANENGFVIRTKSTDSDLEQKVKDKLGEKLGETTVERYETVGPTLGKELLTKTLVAILIASGGILIYVAYRFGGNKYGICADLAMIHDSLVLVGSFAIFGKLFGIEVDTLFVTAVLTILSFSVHDTIVVYDRIRENLRRFPQMKYEEVVNLSINETLGRSINNSLTIIFMLTALLVLGGETIKPFILALLVGTITGTYSSTFTAAPLLVMWEKWEQKRKKERR